MCDFLLVVQWAESMLTTFSVANSVFLQKHCEIVCRRWTLEGVYFYRHECILCLVCLVTCFSFFLLVWLSHRGHPDPNLTYAEELVYRMGLADVDADPHPHSHFHRPAELLLDGNIPDFGAAADGDAVWM